MSVKLKPHIVDLREAKFIACNFLFKNRRVHFEDNECIKRGL
jgi:hypothetical protein